MKEILAGIIIFFMLIFGFFAYIQYSDYQGELRDISRKATTEAFDYGPCGVERLKEYSRKIGNMIDRWNDTLKIANDTNRFNMAGPISAFQTIKRDMDSINTPACVVSVHLLYKSAMDSFINGYIRYMRMDSKDLYEIDFKKGTRDFEDANKGLEMLFQCAPHCR